MSEERAEKIEWKSVDLADMPPGTDCPYPIRILAFFEMIRPYQCDTDLRQITEKTIYEYIYVRVVKKNQFCRRHTYLFPLNFRKKREISLRWSTIDLVNERCRPNPTVAPREVKAPFLVLCCWLSIFISVAIFLQTASPYHRVNVFAIHRCINEGYGFDTDFHGKNTDFPQEIMACLIWWQKESHNRSGKIKQIGKGRSIKTTENERQCLR